MPSSYFIYYRVNPSGSGACEAGVGKLLAMMRKKTGIAGRLMKKRGEPLLWMEVYENVSNEAQFEWELAEAVAALGLQDFLQPGGNRHVECFLQ
jgi:hypothetical protein